MNAEQVDAFVAAASDGVDCDGLVVDPVEEGYRVATPTDVLEGLDEAGLRTVADANQWLVSNWYYWRCIERPADEQAFLRWIEDADDRAVVARYEALADGITATWGQLHIEVALDPDGHRRYQLRHVADAETAIDGLDVHTDPFAMRELVTTDDRGRYRPLKTAPTLQTGWAIVDLDGRGLTRAVDLCYPATVANWHRERHGELDVCHYRETAERQTGIYDLVDELPVAAVERLAEAFCVDSQCLKRREWDEAADRPLDVPRGEGAFPCREPCSLVIAAARTFTLLEREAPETYTVELTPSEKAQFEALLDAVADGRIDEIREADFTDGANRFRARYLRAKLRDAGLLEGETAGDE